MTVVQIEAPARLHFGMFDLTGSLGRRFGGIGVAVTRPAVILEAKPDVELTADGPDAERAVAFARRYMDATGIRAGAHLHIERSIPRHVGLGSGTKLGLAVAQALATLYDQSDAPYTLAQAVGRGQRSAVGLWTYARGGFVVEGGRRLDEDAPAPLLLQYPMPERWRCVLAIPDGFGGLSGTTEADAFARLEPPATKAAQIAHLVLMVLLPALVEERLDEFGAALTQVQSLVGECFSPIQGDRFSNPRSAELIEAMLDWGVAGAGQSSWGPTVYGLVADEDQGRAVAARAEALLAGHGHVEVVAFDNRGARVWERMHAGERIHR